MSTPPDLPHDILIHLYEQLTTQACQYSFRCINRATMMAATPCISSLVITAPSTYDCASTYLELRRQFSNFPAAAKLHKLSLVHNTLASSNHPRRCRNVLRHCLLSFLKNKMHAVHDLCIQDGNASKRYQSGNNGSMDHLQFTSAISTLLLLECPSLSKLTLDCFTAGLNSIKELAGVTNLHDLNLRHMFDDSKGGSYLMLKELQYLTNLQRLSWTPYAGNYQRYPKCMQDINLAKLKSLRILLIPESFLQGSDIQGIITAMPYLTSITSFGIYMGDINCSNMVAQWTHLNTKHNMWLTDYGKLPLSSNTLVTATWFDAFCLFDPQTPASLMIPALLQSSPEPIRINSDHDEGGPMLSCLAKYLTMIGSLGRQGVKTLHLQNYNSISVNDIQAVIASVPYLEILWIDNMQLEFGTCSILLQASNLQLLYLGACTNVSHLDIADFATRRSNSIREKNLDIVLQDNDEGRYIQEWFTNRPLDNCRLHIYLGWENKCWHDSVIIGKIPMDDMTFY